VGRDFPHLSRPALRSTQPPVQWVPGLSRGKERPGRDADSSPPYSAVIKERVELYLYSPYGPYGLYRASVSVQVCNLHKKNSRWGFTACMEKNYKFIKYFVVKNGGQRSRESVGMQVEIRVYYKEVGR
jgi:hypothetical protein